MLLLSTGNLKTSTRSLILKSKHKGKTAQALNSSKIRGRERERENSNSNSKTLILKDSSVRSIWTYLTARPCYTTNTNKHHIATNIISTIKQLINTVPQFLQMCRNIAH